MELCSECKKKIETEAFDKTTSINGIGTILLGRAAVCKKCNSYVMTVFISFFYLPLIPLRSYRGFGNTSGTKFAGNRVKLSFLNLDMLFYIVWFFIILLTVLKIMGKW